MAKHLYVSVPHPCHEDWQQMTPANKGRHCKSCDKVVIDFALMTDAQMAAYFKNYRGNTCGRFRAEQLNRPILQTASQRLFRPLKYIAASLLAIEVFSQKAQARDVADTINPQTVQTDSTVFSDDSSAASAIVALDSCAEGEVDSCETDLPPYNYTWLQRDTAVQNSEKIILNFPISIDVTIICGGVGTNQTQTEGFSPPLPRFVFNAADYFSKNVWPANAFEQAPAIKLDATGDNKPSPPAKNSILRHFSFAALVRKLKVPKQRKG